MLRVGQTELEIVELPTRACEMESELNSIPIDDKTARPREKRVFHFRQVHVFTEFEMEFSRRFQIL
jgi:hypothetical protein